MSCWHSDSHFRISISANSSNINSNWNAFECCCVAIPSISLHLFDFNIIPCTIHISHPALRHGDTRKSIWSILIKLIPFYLRTVRSLCIDKTSLKDYYGMRSFSPMNRSPREWDIKHWIEGKERSARPSDSITVRRFISWEYRIKHL